MVVSNDCGNSTVSNAIVVSNIKAPARPGVITASSDNICSGETVSFSVPEVKDAETYTWTYSGSGTPTGKSNKISFKPTSNGTLTVVAENSCGVSTSRTLAVKILSKPSRPEAISGNASVCNGTSETYQVAAVSGAEKYTWSYSGNGNPSGTGRSITLKPTSDGVLTVIAENSCGVSASRTLKITVSSLPARADAISGKTNLCNGEEIKYQVPAIVGADTYIWSYSGKGTPSGTGRNITLKPTTSGTLTVSGKNKCGLGTPSTLQIKVTPIPLRPSVIQGGATVCKGTNQTYFVDADADVKSYTWSYTGGETITGTGRTISFKPLSNGTLSVIAHNDCGESPARTLKIVVKDGAPTSQPGPIKGETSYCSGMTQKYTINPVGGAKGYLWTYTGEGQPIGDGTTITLTPITSGTLRVVALSDCGSGVARTLSLSIRAIPKPPVITKKNDVLTSNYNTDNQWYLNGKPIQGANDKTFTVNRKGIYSVEYTSPYGCKSMSESMEILSVSVDEKEVGIDAFTIYPNPNDGYFSIEIIATKVKTARMDIVNVLGQVISSEELKNLYGKQTFKKDLSQYGKGLYFVNLYFEEGVVTRRVVVE
ncbi:MAG: T9SS type A sorting domain-containing protein [Chitinophagales bacterium]|nr:T9SS type A sorting domain-containing protein [Chitinophagales bacterium]